MTETDLAMLVPGVAAVLMAGRLPHHVSRSRCASEPGKRTRSRATAFARFTVAVRVSATRT